MNAFFQAGLAIGTKQIKFLWSLVSLVSMDCYLGLYGLIEVSMVPALILPERKGKKIAPRKEIASFSPLLC